MRVATSTSPLTVKATIGDEEEEDEEEEATTSSKRSSVAIDLIDKERSILA